MDEFNWMRDYLENYKKDLPYSFRDYCNKDVDFINKLFNDHRETLESKYLGKTFFTIVDCKCIKVFVKEIGDYNSLVVYKIVPEESEILYGRKEFTVSPYHLFSSVEDLIDYVFQEDIDII